ncbi:hypothetical protein KAR91_36675 [Candidatus Pacearchaeota archaeon]|nr:hypothetical protein [Candidatus Pacearchaeota archaeon]
MSKFSGFERALIAGSIIGASIFLSQSYENFSLSDRDNPVYEDVEDSYKMVHRAKQSGYYNLSYAILCAIPAVFVKGKKELRDIEEDEARKKE